MKLEIELVPESAWGESLRTKLGRTKWDKLRKKVLADQGNVCGVCGSSEKLQCHEVWKFDDQTEIQSLQGLQAVCSLCHLGSHIGLAQKLADQGHANLDNIIAHFIEVNGISPEKFEEHKTEAFAVWHQRSQKKWKVDLGSWASQLPDA